MMLVSSKIAVVKDWQSNGAGKMPKNKKQKKQEAKKEQQLLRRKRRIIAAISLLIIAVAIYFAYNFFSGAADQELAAENVSLFQSKTALLKEEVFSDQRLEEAFADLSLNNGGEMNYVVFFSISDIDSRAGVIKATGQTLEEAWDNGVKEAITYLRRSLVEPLWVKVDLVDSMEMIRTAQLNEAMRPFRSYFFRKGLALDSDFKTAFLEAELNGNDLIDYEERILDLDNINHYRELYGQAAISALPDELIIFTTIGWFIDEDNEIYPLYSYEAEGYDFGRRIIEEFNRDVAESVIITATEWLVGEIQDDGAFIYGYYPLFNNRLTHYNLLRHTVSIQPLIWLYAIGGRTDLIPHIESTISYLVDDHIVYSDEDTAYVLDRPNDEIKLGGNALAIVLLKEYMDVFGTDRYLDISIALGNGILALMDPEEGTFYHVLNPDFSRKEEYRTVYYDGESAYALALLYEITGDQRWLDAVQTAVENFIIKDYTQYRDHWVAYAMNEVTKHIEDPRYYEFALRNVQENLDEIYYRDTSYHTYLELLMASFELYHRIIENDLEVEYLEQFDADYFIRAILKRAEHMLNGFMFPEYAMYLANPGKVNGTFVIRHDAYRIRIDDVEHFIAGYYNLWRNYDQVNEYRNLYTR